MILMTMIARVADGLPLAASIQEDEQVKKLFLPENPQSPFLAFHFSWAKTLWIIRIRPKGYSRLWPQPALSNVQSNLALTFSSKCLCIILPTAASHWHSFFCSYIIEQDACFLTLCDRNFNKKLAYSFLEDLSQEFYSQHGHNITTAQRPYSFIEFGKMQWWNQGYDQHSKVDIYLHFQIPTYKKLRKPIRTVEADATIKH